MKNRTHIIHIITIWLVYTYCIPSLAFAEKTFTLYSPDKKLKIEINTETEINYQVSHNGQLLLSQSAISLILENGIDIGKNIKIKSVNRKEIQEDIIAPFYRFSKFRAHCNELNLKLGNGFGVIFRAFNEGMAYRFYTTSKEEITIWEEKAEFNFNEDNIAYLAYSTNDKQPMAMAFQNIYSVSPLSKADEKLAFLPTTIDCRTAKVTILESDLEAYPGMFVKVCGNGLKGVFAPYPRKTNFYHWRKQEYVTETEDYICRSIGVRSYPWRILAVSERDEDMPVNNLVYSLASPNRIGDYSWVKPGKAAWEWWNDINLKGVPFKADINMDTYKYYIDFAAANGLEYIIIDEGWYATQNGNMMEVIPELNLPALIDYGQERGVGIVLWTVFNVLDSQLEEACLKYSQMGIKGFKVDFLDRDDQQAVEMVYRIAETTARHQLILDLHGIYKPTGLNRTYPHIVNIESIFGMEETKWTDIKNDMPRYDVTFPYIRMMAGPVDYTPGAMCNATKKGWKAIYSSPMSMGTRCHQLATYIVYDSPFTMLCDSPSNYADEKECVNFISSIPVEPDSTFILTGTMGEDIVTVRKKGKDWYIGGLTNWDEKDLKIEFSFLEPGKTYEGTFFIDGINSNKNAEDYQTFTQEITAETSMNIHLASGGGFAIRLRAVPVCPNTIVRRTGNNWTVDGINIEIDKKIPAFYQKYLEADGLYIITSNKVRDEALLKAQQIVTSMLAKRPDIKAEMIRKGCHIIIIGEHEEVCDIPEYAHICNTPENISFWNKRARGFGGSPEDDFSASCGEENVLALPCDRYEGENILVHEFAHLIHMVGICGVESNFNQRLEELRQKAIQKGLWENTYAISNKEEYFAECVQSFFDCNRYEEKSNGVHNAINCRSKLKMYDPEMHALLQEYFYETTITNTIHP